MALLNKMTKEQMKEVAENLVPDSSGYIFTSGVYPVKILWVEIQKARNSNAKSFAIRYEANGVESTLFGPFIENKDGKRNEIGFSKLLELQCVVGVNELNTVEKTVTEKSGTRTATCIKELSGKEVIIQTILEYSKYNGDIVRRMKVVGFYRASDKASMVEIVNGKDIGSRYEFVTSGDKPKCKETRYLDGVTAEEAQAFEDRRKAEREGASATESKKADDATIVDDSDEMPF